MWSRVRRVTIIKFYKKSIDMKVALLFAGRIKAFDKCMDSFKRHILGPLAGHQVDGYAALNAENRHDGLDIFLREYNIRRHENILIDTSAYNYIPRNTQIDGGRTHAYTMYYCWYRAFKLMEESEFKYDIIIYLRADHMYLSSLYIPSIPLEDILYIPTGMDEFGGLCDQFAFGNYTVMKHYTNIYNCIETLYNTTRILFHTETYVGLHNRGKFPIQRFPLSFVLHPARWR